MSMKNSNDTIGNRPATFRLVAQCLKQLRQSKPQETSSIESKYAKNNIALISNEFGLNPFKFTV
jgi:hypothetical protein